MGLFPGPRDCVSTGGPPLVLVTRSPDTWLASGENLSSLWPLSQALAPSWSLPPPFDNGYTGVFGVYDTGSQLIAFYHAEDEVDVPINPDTGAIGYYGSIGRAVSTNGGATFPEVTKSQVIKSWQDKLPYSADKWAQGVGGGGSIVVDYVSPGGPWIYCYYTDHAVYPDQEWWRKQVCLARSHVSHQGEPGYWYKWNQGWGNDPGIGGHEYPVLDARGMPGYQAPAAKDPHVTFQSALDDGAGRYVMVHDLFAWQEREKDAFCIASSCDGINWSMPTPIVTGIRCSGKDGWEVAFFPVLRIHPEGPYALDGWLYYAYSPEWHPVPYNEDGPTYLAGRPIRIWTPRCLGHWPMDEGWGATTGDVSGHGNDGALINMEPEDWTQGRVGEGLRFDGIDEFVYIGCGEVLRPRHQISLMAWVRREGDSQNVNASIVGQEYNGQPPTFGSYNLRINPVGGSPSQVAFFLGWANGYDQVVSYPELPDGNWCHVAATWDRSVMRVYLNGVDRSSTTVERTQDIVYSGCPTVISKIDRAFKGVLDDVRIYNYALTEDEIEGVMMEAPDQHEIRGSGVRSPGVRDDLSLSLSVRDSRAAVAAVYDLLGRKIKDLEVLLLVDDRAATRWDGLDERGARVPNGMYIIRVESDATAVSRRVVIAE